MIDIGLRLNGGYQWFSENDLFVKGAAFDDFGKFLSGCDLLSFFQNIVDFSDFQHRLRRLNGIFSVVARKNDVVWAAADRLRTFPLFYWREGEQAIISDDYRYFTDKIATKINESAAKVLSHFGYVMGDETLLDRVFQLQAGDCLSIDNEKVAIGKWRSVSPQINSFSSREEGKKQLREKIVTTGKRLSEMVGERPVAVPLSGGFDSRLIALLLKMNGHENVLCFTYGNPDFWEAKISKEIAEKLGYEWIMIDYRMFLNDDFAASETFLNYADFVGNAVSFPYLVEYFAAQYLKTQRRLPEDAIFLPGHSGDMIGGSHLFADMEHFKTKRDLAQKIWRKNGRQLPFSSSDKRFLMSEIERNIRPERFDFSFLAHDDWNISQRQSKQIVNSSKVWDYFGYKYLLPLWDNDLTDFCLSMPFEFRRNKNLYDETLMELFAENNLPASRDRIASKSQQKKNLLKLQLKERFPLIAKMKKGYYIQNSDQFFYYETFLEVLKKELPPFEYEQGNAVMSAWYAKHVREKIGAEN